MAVPAGFIIAKEGANAVGKAGQAIQKPVFGSRTVYEFDGRDWVPVMKETRREVPAWMAGLAILGAAIGLGTAATTVKATNERLSKREE